MKTTKYLLPVIMALAIGITFSSCKKESSEKQIISFVFNDLNPIVKGTINHSSGTIDASVPESTDLTNLKPTITVSDLATVNPPSGSPRDFTNPVQYTVTAEDGSTLDYMVKVTPEGSSDHIEIIWTAIADSPTKRGWMPAVASGDKLYIIGGVLEGGTTCTATMEVYDPATNTWDTTKSRMTYRRFAHSANAVDGKIYVMGGVMEPVGQALNVNEVYDPLTDEWTEAAPLPQVRAAHGSCVLDGKIYIIGGETGEPTGQYEVLDDVEVYDPANNSWESKAPLPAPLAYLSTSVVNGKIYVIGGTAENPWDGMTTVYEYDPQTNSWKRKNDINLGRWALSTCVINDMIFCMGGSVTGLSSGTTRVEIYSPGEDKNITSTGMLNKAYARGACVNNQKIYVFGGCISPYPYESNTNKAAVGVPAWE